MIIYLAVLIYGAFSGVFGLGMFYEMDAKKPKWLIYNVIVSIIFGLLWFIGWPYMEIMRRKKNLR